MKKKARPQKHQPHAGYQQGRGAIGTPGAYDRSHTRPCNQPEDHGSQVRNEAQVRYRRDWR